MEKETAKELIEKYVKAWKEKDLKMFLDVLHDHAEVRECTGAVYYGKKTLGKWFTIWNKGTNRVINWEINSFGFDKKKLVA